MIDGATRLIVESTVTRTDIRATSAPKTAIYPTAARVPQSSREAFRKSRLQYLRDKIDRYRRKTLDAQEVAYLTHVEFAFLSLGAGDYPTAMLAFASAGWEISEVEGKRLREIFALVRVAD